MADEDDEAWPPEPSPAVYERGALRMERTHGCFRDLTWRVSGHERLDLDDDAFGRTFIEAGFEDRSHSALVWEFANAEADVLVFVPKTRRLELRIWASRRYRERGPAAAERLQRLSRAFEKEERER